MLSSLTVFTHAQPAAQPQSVGEISERLYPAYTVEGGRVHLAGCVQEERLFVRLDRPKECGPALFFDAEGNEIAPALRAELGLEQVTTIPAAPPLGRPVLDQFARQVLPRLLEAHPDASSLAAIWCKHVEGKLRFTIDEHTADVPFTGWATQLHPPAYHCPYSGADTFHVAMDGDGRIVPFERLAACEESGLPTLVDDLVTCTASGKRVRAQFIERCAASNEPVLQRLMAACPACGQMVSPRHLSASGCAACRRLEGASKADPRVKSLLAKYPGLARMGGWQVGETASVYVFRAAGWLRQYLLVVDKATLSVARLSTKHRFTASWQVIPADRYAAVLGS